MSKIEDPLIQVNWSKIKHCLGRVLGLARKLGEEALKTILKILILLVRLITKIYITLSTFAKSKQRGIWIIILIFLLLLTSFSFLNREKKCLDLLKRFNDNEQKYEELLNDYQELYNQVKEIEDKLKTQSNTKSKTFSLGVEQYRYLIIRYFPPQQVENALAIMACESGGNQKAVNHNDTKVTGYASYGLFQINGPDNWKWDNPDKNIDRAVTIFYTQGWRAWKNCAKDLGLIN